MLQKRHEIYNLKHFLTSQDHLMLYCKIGNLISFFFILSNASFVIATGIRFFNAIMMLKSIHIYFNKVWPAIATCFQRNAIFEYS